MMRLRYERDERMSGKAGQRALPHTWLDTGKQALR